MSESDMEFVERISREVYPGFDGWRTVSMMDHSLDRLFALARRGAHLCDTARSLGWPDDGEGALEFIMRRTREVALEDALARRGDEMDTKPQTSSETVREDVPKGFMAGWLLGRADAAKCADEFADKWNAVWRKGLKCDSHLEGMSDGADDVAQAIRALPPPAERNRRMSDIVVPYPGLTTHDINPDKVLQGAVGALQDAIVAGIDMDGNEYFASSYGSTADTLFLLERFKKMLLEASDEQ